MFEVKRSSVYKRGILTIKYLQFLEVASFLSARTTYTVTI